MMNFAARLRHPFLVLTIAAAILAPSIPLTDTFSLRPEFLLAGVLFVWLLPTARLAPLRHPLFKWMGLLALLIAVSLGNSALVLGRPISLQDAFEVAKVGVYAIVFYAALAAPVDDSQLSKTILWLQIIFMISAVVGIFQYFNLLDINTHLTPLYLKASYATSIAGSRIVGTTSNPNYYGMLMLLGASLALASFLWAGSWRDRWLPVLSLVACTASMLLAASRTVLAIFPLAVLYIVIRFIVRARKDKKDLRLIGAIALGSAALLALMLVLLPSAWFARMGDLLHIFESESMQLKFENWREHWRLYQQSPIFGLGPAKGTISLNVDNEWLLFLVRYGIAGPILAFMLGLSMFRTTEHIVRRTLSSVARGFAITLQAFLLASMIFMVTAAIYHHQQLMAILLLLVGLGQGIQTLTRETVGADAQ
jgi:O-antigen ligase